MKLSIFKWDHQLGPAPIRQYPPDLEFPKKEILLRIWALHELNNESIVNFVEDHQNYLSIMYKSHNEFYFSLLELNIKENSSKYQDVFLNLSPTLFNAIGKPNFSRILSETYSMIEDYSKLNRDQLFFNLYKDKHKLIILNSLRKGVISKDNLCQNLNTRYGLAETNFDILITPFQHLGLVTENTIHGSNNFYMIKDVYGGRIPPNDLYHALLESNDDMDKKYISYLIEFFNTYRPEKDDEENLMKISKLLSDSQIYNSLKILYENKLKRGRFLDMISQDIQSYQKLRDLKLIIEVEDFLYPLSEIHFFTFTPLYIISELGKRFQKNEISTEELICHIRLLQSVKE
ncbi:MAG: hypothetical protein JW776_14230 [Candidatus Lokiarchaeota archaeon]|nr:hypothetical protein [Candidatus Lokiarchaeota archaeon]